MNVFSNLVRDCFSKGVLTKLILSRPIDKSSPKKVSCRLCAHRNQKILAVEYSLEGNTVSQRNLREGEISDFLATELPGYMQANLLTQLGDAELKLGKDNKTVLLGADKLRRKLSADLPEFGIKLESLCREIPI